MYNNKWTCYNYLNYFILVCSLNENNNQLSQLKKMKLKCIRFSVWLRKGSEWSGLRSVWYIEKYIQR